MTAPQAPLRVLVTGGAGFLGQALVVELRDEAARAGRAVHIALLDVKPPRNGDENLTGDVREAGAVNRACLDRDVVIHAASAVDWGNTPADFLREVNVVGTRNVIDACRTGGVRALVYTSTIDVIFAGQPLYGADERAPYPERFLDHYGATKAEAERLVLAANGTPGTDGPLLTTSLRPCGMYGEGDPYHLGSVLRAARAGDLTFRLGDGSAHFHHVYVGNVANAHARAVLLLGEGGERAARMGGRAYFVTDQEASNFFDFMKPFVEALGYRMPERRIPARVALAMAALAEGGARLLRPVKSVRPLLTRSAVRILTTTQSFDGRALEADLGWTPRYSVDEAFQRSVAWFRANPA